VSIVKENGFLHWQNFFLHELVLRGNLILQHFEVVRRPLLFFIISFFYTSKSNKYAAGLQSFIFLYHIYVLVSFPNKFVRSRKSYLDVDNFRQYLNCVIALEQSLRLHVNSKLLLSNVIFFCT
jgi:hypothetical protein